MKENEGETSKVAVALLGEITLNNRSNPQLIDTIITGLLETRESINAVSDNLPLDKQTILFAIQLVLDDFVGLKRGMTYYEKEDQTIPSLVRLLHAANQETKHFALIHLGEIFDNTIHRKMEFLINYNLPEEVIGLLSDSRLLDDLVEVLNKFAEVESAGRVVQASCQ
jgi:hypothetical protein